MSYCCPKSNCPFNLPEVYICFSFFFFLKVFIIKLGVVEQLLLGKEKFRVEIVHWYKYSMG